MKRNDPNRSTVCISAWRFTRLRLRVGVGTWNGRISISFGPLGLGIAALGADPISCGKGSKYRHLGRFISQII